MILGWGVSPSYILILHHICKKRNEKFIFVAHSIMFCVQDDVRG